MPAFGTLAGVHDDAVGEQVANDPGHGHGWAAQLQRHTLGAEPFAVRLAAFSAQPTVADCARLVAAWCANGYDALTAAAALPTARLGDIYGQFTAAMPRSKIVRYSALDTWRTAASELGATGQPLAGMTEQEREVLAIFDAYDAVDQAPSLHDLCGDLASQLACLLVEIEPTSNAGVDMVWHGSNAELFIGAIDPADVQQQVSNSCFFLAPLAALAAVAPDQVQAMFRPIAGGWAVRLYMGGKPVDVAVSGDVATTPSGQPAIATSPSGERWPAMAEKASLKLGGGGTAITGMELLGITFVRQLQPPYDAAMMMELKAHLASGGIAVAWSGGHVVSIVSVDDDGAITVRDQAEPEGKTIAKIALADLANEWGGGLFWGTPLR